MISTQPNLKQTILIGSGLFVLTLLSRLPFREQILYHWDSIGFAFSVTDFDVINRHPHYPGYILYVGLARLVNIIVNDPEAALVWISVVGSGLTVAGLYILGLTMFNRTVGLVAALFLASSPLYWFYGEISLPHGLDALAVIVAIGLLYRLTQGQVSTAGVIVTASWLGLVGGLRPQTLMFLSPLMLYVSLHLRWRRILLALSVLIVANLAWFIPLLWLNGGWSPYYEGLSYYSQEFGLFNVAENLTELTRNVRKLVMYTAYGLGFALVSMGLGAIIVLRSLLTAKPTLPQDVRFWMLLFWIVPSAGYYILLHMGNHGLTLIFLPALIILGAVSLSSLPWSQAIYWRLIVAVLVVGNGLIFIIGPTYPLGKPFPKLLTADTLQQHNTYYLSRIAAVRYHFPVQHTLLFTSNWPHLQYYLQDYLPPIRYQITAKWELKEGLPVGCYNLDGENNVLLMEWIDGTEWGLIPDNNGFLYIVLFDEGLIHFNQSPERQQEIKLKNNPPLIYMAFRPGERFYCDSSSYKIIPPEKAS